MIIDVHGHVSPPGERGGGPPSLRDPEAAIERKRALGVWLTVIGSPVGAGEMRPLPGVDNYRQSADQVKAHNELMAGHVDRHPDALRTVYGPRQRDDMAISRMIMCALSGRPWTIFGDGSQRRDFTFVSDVVRGNLLAMTADAKTAVVNLGTGTSTSTAQLSTLVGEAVGRPLVTRYGPPEDGDVPFTLADISGAAGLLGYRPTVSLATGIQRQVAWIRDNQVAARGA